MTRHMKLLSDMGFIPETLNSVLYTIYIYQYEKSKMKIIKIFGKAAPAAHAAFSPYQMV